MANVYPFFSSDLRKAQQDLQVTENERRLKSTGQECAGWRGGCVKCDGRTRAVGAFPDGKSALDVGGGKTAPRRRHEVGARGGIWT